MLTGSADGSRCGAFGLAGEDSRFNFRGREEVVKATLVK